MCSAVRNRLVASLSTSSNNSSIFWSRFKVVTDNFLTGNNIKLNNDNKLLGQLITSLLSQKPCTKFKNKQCEHILMASCWNSIGTSLLQVCYMLCAVMFTAVTVYTQQQTCYKVVLTCSYKVVFLSFTTSCYRLEDYNHNNRVMQNATNDCLTCLRCPTVVGWCVWLAWFHERRSVSRVHQRGGYFVPTMSQLSQVRNWSDLIWSNACRSYYRTGYEKTMIWCGDGVRDWNDRSLLRISARFLVSYNCCNSRKVEKKCWKNSRLCMRLPLLWLGGHSL